MSYASETLSDIIAHSFDGRKSSLTESTGLASSTISRLTAGSIQFTAPTLAAICRALITDDARRLCLAVCRDIIPSELADTIDHPTTTKDHSPPYNPGPRIDAYSERILHELRHLVAQEPETKAWLHRMGPWLNISPISADDLLAPADRAAAKRTVHKHSEDTPHKDPQSSETP